MADHNLSARETPTRPSSTAVSVPPPVRESRPPLRGPAMRHQGRVPGAMSNPQLNNNEGMISPMHADPHFAFHLAQQQQLLLGSSARQVRLITPRLLIVRTNSFAIFICTKCLIMSTIKSRYFCACCGGASWTLACPAK